MRENEREREREKERGRERGDYHDLCACSVNTIEEVNREYLY